MLYKTFRLKLSREKIILTLSGEEARKSLGNLYNELIKNNNNFDVGLAGINLFLELFGPENTEKLLRFCEAKPRKAMILIKRLIKYIIFPLASKQNEQQLKNKNCCFFPLVNHVFIKERKILINTDFTRVIQAASLLKREEISNTVKINAALKLLLKRKLRRVSYSDKIILLNKIFDLLGAANNNPQDTKNALSLEKDSAFIYGAFLQSFGINLKKDKLDWREFCALLSCVPENTALYNIIKIRTAEIPADSEQASQLYALKKLYSLHENDENNYHNELEKLFNTGSALRSIPQKGEING